MSSLYQGSKQAIDNTATPTRDTVYTAWMPILSCWVYSVMIPTSVSCEKKLLLDGRRKSLPGTLRFPVHAGRELNSPAWQMPISTYYTSRYYENTLISSSSRSKSRFRSSMISRGSLMISSSWVSLSETTFCLTCPIFISTRGPWRGSGPFTNLYYPQRVSPF